MDGFAHRDARIGIVSTARRCRANLRAGLRDDAVRPAAIHCGSAALNQIAETIRVPYDKDPYPDQPISVSREDFGEAMSMLRGVGYPIEVTDDEAWVHFRGWRVNYDRAALGIARAVDAPPAMWTGPRRYPSTPMTPLRPPSRTPKAQQD